MLVIIAAGMPIALILSLPTIYSAWLRKQFYRSVPDDLHYPITLGSIWLREWAYKIAALPFLVTAVGVPLLIRPPWEGWLEEIIFVIVICLGPTLIAIGCWLAGNACRDRKLVLDEKYITYIKSPKRQIRIEKDRIERYWIGIEGSLVLQDKYEQKRTLIPLAFENIALINKSLSSRIR